MISENDTIQTNSMKAWLLAARPKTLSAAAVPVIIGFALALKTVGWREFQVVPALLCLLFAWLMQIDSNLINDYFDFVRGNDDRETRLGPKRACAEGWITLPAMRWALAITSVSACVVGLPLIAYGGWNLVGVGALCVVFAFLYTTFLPPRDWAMCSSWCSSVWCRSISRGLSLCLQGIRRSTSVSCALP